MAELSQAARNYLDDLSRQPGARQPATLGEIWDSEWKRGGLDTISGIGKPLADATEALRTAIATEAGMDIAQYAADKRVPIGSGVTADQGIKLLNDLGNTLPEESQRNIANLRDVRKRAAETAQKTERDAADVAGATYGLGGTATAWAASIARQTVDPINIGTMIATAPIGGPITGGALKFIGGQALAGAASQAVVEPYIEPARAELGLESGFGRAMTNIFEAGVGGAVLGSAGVGIHRLFGAAADSYRAARAVEAPAETIAPTPATSVPDPVTGHPAIDADDFAAAALHAERDVAINEQIPAGTDPAVHAERLHEATRAIEEGQPLPRTEADPILPPEPPPARAAQEELPLRQPEPLAPPKEPPVTAAKDEPDVIGNPELAADVDRRLAQFDGDFVVQIEQADKTIKAGSAKSFLREIQNDASAVKELIDCIGQEPQ
jgi:hypothetical protein